MNRTLLSSALALMTGIFFTSQAAHAEFKQPRAAGIETYGYAWNSPDQDMNRALAHKADPSKGEAAYKVCKGCHKPMAPASPMPTTRNWPASTPASSSNR
jgi:hypothetical protein